MAGLFQYGYFARGVNQRQFVRESFLLSDRDHAILFFLCFVDYLYCLPKSNMSLIITSKDAVEESGTSQKSDMAGVQGCQGPALADTGSAKRMRPACRYAADCGNKSSISSRGRPR